MLFEVVPARPGQFHRVPKDRLGCLLTRTEWDRTGLSGTMWDLVGARLVIRMLSARVRPQAPKGAGQGVLLLHLEIEKSIWPNKFGFPQQVPWNCEISFFVDWRGAEWPHTERNASEGASRAARMAG